MSAAALAATLLERGIELIERNNRLRVWPAKSFRTLSAAERAGIRAHRAELKALVRAGLTTLPDNASAAVKAHAVARLRECDSACEMAPTVSPPNTVDRGERRMHWDERSRTFVPDLGITI